MAGVLGEDVLKRIKALRKKLTQIEKLKARGGQYTEEEATKIKGESKILAEIQALEKGEEVAAFDEAGGQEEQPQPPPPEAKPEPEDSGEAEASASKEPDLAPAEAEKRIRGLKKKLGQIQKLKERGGGFSKEESEKVGAEPSLLAECTELEIKLLEPEARKAARNLQKKLDQISKLRTKGGLTPQEREKVGKEGSLKKELTDILAARVPMKEPAAQAAEQSPTPDAKAAPKAAQVAQVAQKQAPAPAVDPKPQPQQPQPAQHKPAPRSAPQPEQARMSTYVGQPSSMTATQGAAPVEDEAHVEDDAHVAAALAQAFAQEELLEEEGFLESRASTRKRAIQAKAQARAEAARLQQEQLAAERAQQEQEAAERARQEQDRRLEERHVAAQRAQQEERERLAAAQREREAALAAEAAAEADEEPDPVQEEMQVEEEAAAAPEVVEAAPEAAAESAVEVVPEAATLAVPLAEPAPAPEAVDAAPTPERPAPEKRLRALKKKATQIDKLKQRGGEYTPEESEKLASEESVLAEIAALERGDPWPPVVVEVHAVPEPVPVVQQEEVVPVEVTEAPPQAAPPLEVSSMDPVDAHKRLKALKKKLGQIEKLKERSGPFSPEETTKIASQPHVLEDIKKLEEYLA